MRNWRLEQTESWTTLTLDCAGSRVNTLGRAVLEELDSILRHLQEERPSALVIASGKSSGFIAGADVRDFQHIDDIQQAEAAMRLAHDVLGRLAALPFRTLAWIDGFCLGGGLELALACDVRLASDDARTRLGFPEVKLGIHPGFGGTVRACRLLGGWKALPLMLTGKEISARRARALGLVHDVLPARHHMRAIAHWLHHDMPNTRAHWSNHRMLRPAIAGLLRWQTGKKVREAHYPAPFRLIELWRRHGDDPSSMFEEEIHSVARLITDDRARALIRCFFLRQGMKCRDESETRDIRRVHVIGAGVMGGDIAAWCVLRGFHVTLQDTAPARIAPALGRAHACFQQRLRDKTRVQEAMDRLWPDADGAGLRDADVVIEAVFEDLEVKQEVLRRMEQQAPANAILATNTSSIPLQSLSQALREPARLVGLHFFNPVARMPLIEIVRTEETYERTVQRAKHFASALDKLPLPVRSAPGFLVNRILMPYLLQAMRMVEEGLEARYIDHVACQWGMPVGPLRLADQVGLDICLHVARTLLQDDKAIPRVLRRHVDAGELGKKSGRGFYRYGRRASLRWPGRGEHTAREQEVRDRLVFSMLNEAVACVHEKVVDSADLCDAGMIFGTGFAPFRGGPMQVIAELGMETCLQRLTDLAARHGEVFQPHPGWRHLPEFHAQN